MGKYQIKVNVEIVECSESELSDMLKQEEGSLKMTISEEDAISIDKCEQALLKTSYKSIREAISRHLTEVSKKNSRTWERRRNYSQSSSISGGWRGRSIYV